MKNKKHFKSTSQERKTKSRTYQISFDDKYFGDTEIRVDTHTLVQELNNWWDNICTKNGLNPRDKKIFNLGYHIIELGKNALEYANGGEIKTIFEGRKITVVVSDQGQGFEDLDWLEYSTSPTYGHGLAEIRRYADEFMVETLGVKYAKVPGKRKLVEIGDSDIQHGSKITFIKYFK